MREWLFRSMIDWGLLAPDFSVQASHAPDNLGHNMTHYVTIAYRFDTLKSRHDTPHVLFCPCAPGPNPSQL